ncbi:collagenase [Sporosarcina sp. Marseille-Q4063]|uniref:peptidase MA family metallohydrolase n=1 Tax=Sporosarcina sp. Marseille-Q4063 TaxID=2810514 RepID=UPI001BAEF894|nr:collagenase [Sporosarcina sp. Marseille-Q4063]QUW20256.1 collagenase [Sporosarcina sp. Marseille-Q4063]
MVEKKDGITYFYSLETEQYINRFHTLLLEEKSTFDNFFGSDDLAPLTIEIYDDLKSLNDKQIYLNDIGGYYNEKNHSIHLVGEENIWPLVLLHEYTHYRIDQFGKANDFPSFERLPVWFHEGLSEVMGHGIDNFNLGDINHISIQDFNLLDHYDSFHQLRHEGHDPYQQSYFAVQSIVDNYGVKALQRLLLSKTIDGFYDNLEKLTNKSLDEFQQTFPENLVAAQELINDKFSSAREAMNTKNYDKSETILTDVIYEGNQASVSRANYELLNLYLEQNLFEKALTQLDILNSNEENGNKTITLKQQAEIYLLVDSKKALTTIKLAKVEVPTDHWLNPIIDELAEAFRLINSDNPVEGYRLLFEEDLLISDKVLTNLHEKLVIEYPGEF